MNEYKQAPVLLSKGEKHRGTLGKAIRSHELEIAIMNGLGERDTVAIKIMFFLTGNADNGSFRVSEKTICERCNISESGYKTARKKLISRGWIEHKDGKITVLYDNIYNWQQYKS